MTDATAPHFDRSALITIDVQRDTLDGQPLEVPGTSAILPNIAALAAAFRAAPRPIVHVVRLYRADGANAEPSRRDLVSGAVPVLRPGTDGRRLAPGLLVHNDGDLDDDLLFSGGVQQLGDTEYALYKPRWGAFFHTQLESHLRILAVDTVVFAGCNFPNCPRTSIYEASERDFRIVAVDDAISGMYERGCEELRNIGVHLYSTASVTADVAAAQAHLL